MRRDMPLKKVAQETLRIVGEGRYISPTGKMVAFFADQQAAVNGTILYSPERGTQLLQGANSCEEGETIIEVTSETTQVAAHRLVCQEGCTDLVLLNYASARKPGGGFLNGAKAQEEDLSRCSGLYPCLLTQPTYYEQNRADGSLLYTDHLIYSPNVPWFRRHSGELLEEVFLASVITAPAPNASKTSQEDKAAWAEIETFLNHRAGIILAAAREQGHRTLLLGAWGCGVFRNKPKMVANAFAVWLEHSAFRGCFDRVVFAVYDTSKNQETLRAFEKRLLKK